MEEEEEDVEVGDLLADGVYLGLFEGDAAEDEFLLLQPLFQEKLVGRGSSDLVKRVRRLRWLHDRSGVIGHEGLGFISTVFSSGDCATERDSARFG